MFILEEPYVSELCLKTLEKNQFPVLDNSVSKKYKNKYSLNIVSPQRAIEECKNKLNVYKNSEKSINWVFDNFKEYKLAKAIEISKNKYAFRKKISSIYPKFFFKEISLSELDKTDIKTFPKPFIIKPTVGFLSLGVH